MRKGDIVTVRGNDVWDFERHIYERTFRYRGIVEFISDSWVTVLLLSVKNNEPLFRQAFWKHQVHVVKSAQIGGNNE